MRVTVCRADSGGGGGGGGGVAGLSSAVVVVLLCFGKNYLEKIFVK